MTEPRSLIVNADDFGQSTAINRGIIRAYEQGVVTSASLMVLWPAAKQAANYARLHPNLSVGLHVDLAEWSYRDGTWIPVYQRVPLEDVELVTHEISRQITLFHQLTGGAPSHLDSHQHVHLHEPVRSVLIDLAQKINVPLRACRGGVQTYGGFYGQTAEGEQAHDGITTDRLLETLANLPSGVTELSCHPGEAPRPDDVDEPNTMYRIERSLELTVLCDPRVRAALTAHGIRLCSFQQLGRP